MVKKKYQRKCPCGSGLFFKDCCEIPVEGETPEEIKKIIENCIIKTFEYTNSRAELCIYVANLTKDLLELFDIRSYVVAGSAKWKYYTTWFQWKPHDTPMQYHAWCISQYGETIDLACGAMNERFDGGGLQAKMLNLKPPSNCWCKNPSDREYIVRDLGAKQIAMSEHSYKRIKKTALNLRVTNE
ncbi:MAG: hypothetical protein ABFD04_00610 [Syntrophomonas sp.]